MTGVLGGMEKRLGVGGVGKVCDEVAETGKEFVGHRAI